MSQDDSGNPNFNDGEDAELGPAGPPSPRESPTPAMVAQEANLEENHEERAPGYRGIPSHIHTLIQFTIENADPNLLRARFEQFGRAPRVIADRRFPPIQVDHQRILEGLSDTTVEKIDATGATHGPLECSICLEFYLPEQALVVLPCHPSHHFHRSCLEDWLTNHATCPLCRNSLETSGDSD